MQFTFRFSRGKTTVSLYNFTNFTFNQVKLELLQILLGSNEREINLGIHLFWFSGLFYVLQSFMYLNHCNFSEYRYDFLGMIFKNIATTGPTLLVANVVPETEGPVVIPLCTYCLMLEACNDADSGGETRFEITEARR